MFFYCFAFFLVDIWTQGDFDETNSPDINLWEWRKEADDVPKNYGSPMICQLAVHENNKWPTLSAAKHKHRENPSKQGKQIKKGMKKRNKNATKKFIRQKQNRERVENA